MPAVDDGVVVEENDLWIRFGVLGSCGKRMQASGGGGFFLAWLDVGGRIKGGTGCGRWGRDCSAVIVHDGGWSDHG